MLLVLRAGNITLSAAHVLQVFDMLARNTGPYFTSA